MRLASIDLEMFKSLFATPDECTIDLVGDSFEGDEEPSNQRMVVEGSLVIIPGQTSPMCGEEITAAMGGVKERYKRSCSKFTFARTEKSIIA